MGSAANGLGVATGPIALLDAGSRLLNHIHRVLQNPKQRARLAERANILLKMLRDMVATPDDVAYRLIHEDLESVIKDVESLSRDPFTWIWGSVEHGRLQEVESKLQDLIGNVSQLYDRVSCSNQAVDPPICNIGLDRCDQALKFLEESQASQLPRVIGIYGQAGVGKTTLLNHIWNKAAAKPSFHAQAYVQVGENVTSKTITKLQSSIYWQLSNQRVEFPTPDFGKGKLSRLFKNLREESKPICLAIDNVFKEQHFMDLLPSKFTINEIPVASCIAVTCRDHKIVKAMLKICGLGADNSSQKCVFEPRCLSPEDSKRLFAECAGVEHSDPALQDLLNAMVPLCGGLPLALTVLGSIFKEEEKRKPEEWPAIKSQWASLRDPGDADTSKVTDVLNLSYENLKKSRKEAFMDVAICFNGWPWVLVEGIVGKELLADLRESSLIWQVHDINQCNQSEQREEWWLEFNERIMYKTFVSMHDLTLRFAKSHLAEHDEYVARPLTSLEDLPKPISLKNLILWIGDEHCSQQLFSYIQEASGLQTLIVRKKTDGPSMIQYRSAAIGVRQQSLRYLDLEGEWAGEESSFLMKKEALRDIVYLSLERCCIEDIGEFSMPCLQVLKISIFSGVKVDLGKLRSLRVLCLSNCERLMKLAESIGGMESLVYLNVTNCINLVELPEDIGKLHCLKELCLNSCGSLQKLPESMCGMENLERLDLFRLGNLVDLPADIGKVRSLKEMKLSGCKSLQKLPDSMCGMEYLERLDLQMCGNLVDLPGDIGKLRCLKELDLAHCRSLEKLPESLCGMEYLERLNLWGCENLVDLPGDIGKLRRLKILNLSECGSLQKLPESLGGMESLETLYVAWCGSLVELPAWLGKMRSLTRLVLSNCKMLEKFEGSMESLEFLGVWESSNGGGLSGGVVEKLPSLKRLCFNFCDSVTEMLADEVVGRMECLEALQVWRCYDLRELPEAVGKLRSLKALDLSYCRNLKKLPEFVGSMESLETLKLKGCEALEELPEQLAMLTSLQRLDIRDCDNLQKLPVLSSSVIIDRD